MEKKKKQINQNNNNNNPKTPHLFPSHESGAAHLIQYASSPCFEQQTALNKLQMFLPI